MINNLWELHFISMHYKRASSNWEDDLYSGDIISSAMWDCLDILVSLFELGILQNCRIQITKNNLMKKKYCKFKLLILKVQGIDQCIADNFSLPQLKWLDVRMKLAKGKPFIVNGVTISIHLYLKMLNNLLAFNWRVQLISSRVQKKVMIKIDKELKKKTVNQSNKRKKRYCWKPSKILNAEK